jgi:fucose 4-O-acetylase-like acetyltransferase
VLLRYVFGEYVIPFDLTDTLTPLILSSDWLNSVPTFNFALWFLPIYFITVTLFWVLMRIKSIWLFLTFVTLIAVVSIPIQELIPGRPPLSINVLPVALVMMSLGWIWRNKLKNVRLHPLAAALLLPSSLCTFFLMGSGNIAGAGSYWFYPTSLLAILLVNQISHDFSNSNLLQYLGTNSLPIFGIHSLVANAYRFTIFPDFVTANWPGLLAWLINLLFVLTITCLIISVSKFIFHTPRVT